MQMKNGLVIKTELLNYMRMWRFSDNENVVEHTTQKPDTFGFNDEMDPHLSAYK